MSDYFMGQELPPELPPGSPKPDVTPPEGVILQKIGMDGWTRKYLYQAGLGEDGRRFERKMLVAEIEPEIRPVPRDAVGMGRPSVQGRAAAPSAPVMEMTSLPGRAAPGMASPIRIAQNGPKLGQIGPTAGASPEAPAGAPQGPPSLTCPGPVEMPDGKTLNPDDAITLKYLCDILPYLVENLKDMMAPQGPRTGPVPLTGQQPGGPYATVISPPSGMFGQGGGPGGGGAMAGFPSGGGGGPGPRGLPGPAGIGAAPDFVTKMDGDFTAGPGAFIAVPGTKVPFVQATDGAAIFFLQAVFGCSGFEAQSNQIGLRLTDSNGVQTDFPLTVTLLHTAVAGVGVFFQPAPGMWPATLSAGSYTVEVILRGLSAGEFCAGSGLGFTATVSANAQVPLALVAFHR